MNTMHHGLLLYFHLLELSYGYAVIQVYILYSVQ